MRSTAQSADVGLELELALELERLRNQVHHQGGAIRRVQPIVEVVRCVSPSAAQHAHAEQHNMELAAAATAGEAVAAAESAAAAQARSEVAELREQLSRAAAGALCTASAVSRRNEEQFEALHAEINVLRRNEVRLGEECTREMRSAAAALQSSLRERAGFESFALQILAQTREGVERVSRACTAGRVRPATAAAANAHARGERDGGESLAATALALEREVMSAERGVVQLLARSEEAESAAVRSRAARQETETRLARHADEAGAASSALLAKVQRESSAAARAARDVGALRDELALRDDQARELSLMKATNRLLRSELAACEQLRWMKHAVK